MTTITDEQFEAALKALPPIGDTRDCIKAAFEAAGITIAPPSPPDSMVMLAGAIAAGVDRECFDSGVVAAPSDYALAALQHADKVVREARGFGGCGRCLARRNPPQPGSAVMDTFDDIAEVLERMTPASPDAWQACESGAYSDDGIVILGDYRRIAVVSLEDDAAGIVTFRNRTGALLAAYQAERARAEAAEAEVARLRTFVENLAYNPRKVATWMQTREAARAALEARNEG